MSQPRLDQSSPSDRRGSRWVAAAVTLGILGGWELLARIDVIPALFFPPPSIILSALAQSVASGEMPTHLLTTAGRVIPGLLLGAVPGLLLGLAMGWSRPLRRALDPIVAALHPLPKIAILPLFMIVLGIGEASKIAVVAVATFFPMLINTMAGVRQISPLYFEVASNYGAGKLGLFTRVVLPGSMPMALSGLRLAVNVALLVTIAVEIVAADRGLGALVWLSWEVLRVELLYAALVVVAVLGIVFNSGLRTLHRALIPWHTESHPGA